MPPTLPKKKYERYGLALRIQCLTLFHASIPLHIICFKFYVLKSAVWQWNRIARAQGYDPDVSLILLVSYLEDAPRSGRPTLQTWEGLDN
jgi:hypothetical protein